MKAVYWLHRLPRILTRLVPFIHIQLQKVYICRMGIASAIARSVVVGDRFTKRGFMME